MNPDKIKKEPKVEIKEEEEEEEEDDKNLEEMPVELDNLDSTFMSMHCVDTADEKCLEQSKKDMENNAVLKEESAGPSGLKIENNIDAQVAEAYRILRETNYLSDTEYDEPPFLHKIQPAQEQDQPSGNIEVDCSEEHDSSAPDNPAELPLSRSSPVDTQFICIYCGKSCRTLFLLTEHRKSHTNMKIWKCHACDKRFFTRQSLMKHKFHCYVRQKPSNQIRIEKELHGAEQSSTFNTSKNKNVEGKLDHIVGSSTHMLTPVVQSETVGGMLTQNNTFICKFCKKKCFSKKKLVIHMASHRGIESFVCSVCGKKFRQKVSLDLHNRVHKRFKPGPCSVCGEIFVDHSSWKNHQVIHRDMRPFGCSVCGQRFKQSSTLNDHCLLHSKKRQFCCPQCGQRFPTKQGLRRHLPVHTEVRPFSCDKCGKRFKRKDTLKVHLLTHTSKEPYQNSNCNEKIFERTEFDAHRLTRKREMWFICNICGKRLKNYKLLKEHALVHAYERPFVCSVCRKRFKSKSNLKMHLKTHSRSQIHTYLHSQPPQTHTQTISTSQKIPQTVSTSQTHPHIYIQTFSDSTPQAQPHTLSRSQHQTYTNLEIPWDTHLQTSSEIHTRFGETPFTCKVCGKVFENSKCLKEHVQVHRDKRPFVCPDCGKNFKSSGYLKMHRVVHTRTRIGSEVLLPNEPYYSLQTQPQTNTRSTPESNVFHFNSPSHLVPQTQPYSPPGIHTRKLPFTCKVCGKVFRTKNSLNGHYQVHGGRKSFKLSQYLKRHSIVHSHAQIQSQTHRQPSKSNANTYPQTVTGSLPQTNPYDHAQAGEFENGGSLEEHAKTDGDAVHFKTLHVQRQLSACAFCGKMYEASYLKQHIRIHTEDRPYCCTLCTRRFNWKANLTVHMRKMHAHLTFNGNITV